MRLHSVLAATVIALLTVEATPWAAAANGGAAERSRTVSALTAVEQHWSIAELTGNLPYLRNLLEARYESVNADGRATGKAGILASAVAFSHKPSMLAMYHRMESQYGSVYRIRGRTGVVIHYLAAKGPVTGVTGVDIFSFDPHSGWHAVYSQHTTVR